MAKIQETRGVKPEANVSAEQAGSSAIEGSLGGREDFGPGRSASAFGAGMKKAAAIVNNPALLHSCVALENLPDARRYMGL